MRASFCWRARTVDGVCMASPPAARLDWESPRQAVALQPAAHVTPRPAGQTHSCGWSEADDDPWDHHEQGCAAERRDHRARVRPPRLAALLRGDGPTTAHHVPRLPVRLTAALFD